MIKKARVIETLAKANQKKRIVMETSSFSASTTYSDNNTNSRVVQDFLENNKLQNKHYQELRSSGICDSIINDNFISVKGDEAKEYVLSEALFRLGEGKQTPHSYQYTTAEVQRLLNQYSHLEDGGWWCSGLDPLNNWQKMEWGCFKPDHPRSDISRGKVIKYEHPPKTPTRAFYLDVPKDIWETVSIRHGVPIQDYSESFWKWVKNEKIPVVITEGVKKAAALLTCGIAAIAIPGINSAYRKVDEKKKILIADIESIASPGRKITICFDQDMKIETIKAVRGAINTIGQLLLDNGCNISVASWDAPYKGIDDLLVATDMATVIEIVDEALSFDDYLELSKGKAVRPKADMIAREIAEQYTSKLVYSDVSKSWLLYESELPGIWTPISQESLEAVICRILDSKGIQKIGDYSYISNISKFLRGLLIKSRWDEINSSCYLPFKNGLLELATGKLLPHSPHHYLTWQLPREHDSSATDWTQINAFLDHLSANDPQIKAILLCYCNAVLKGRYDLQKFLHLIGLGGTGKGTYSRLIVSLIGERNVCSSTLHDFCTNIFDGYNAYGKRLVLFAEEDTAIGRIGKFLSLTGEDPLRAEAKGQKAFNFRYQGMTLVCSNMPIFSGQAASRVKRRVITVPCNNRVKKRENLEQKFEGELAAFTNYVLSLSDTYVSDILKGESSTQCALEFWENRIRVDSLASWLNDCVIFDPSVITPVGNDKNEGDNGAKVNTLFGSYSVHCRQNGGQQQSSRNFSPNLLEICGTVLGWEVGIVKKSTGRFITGLRLRDPGIDDHIPTYEMLLEEKNSPGASDVNEIEVPSQTPQVPDEEYDPDVHLNQIVEKIQPPVAQPPVVPNPVAPMPTPTTKPIPQPSTQKPTPPPNMIDEGVLIVEMALQEGKDTLEKYLLAKECFEQFSEKDKRVMFGRLTVGQQTIFREGKKLYEQQQKQK